MREFADFFSRRVRGEAEGAECFLLLVFEMHAEVERRGVFFAFVGGGGVLAELTGEAEGAECFLAFGF
ncbi:MAG: hypothetical protein ACPGXZ_07275 [Saprospiraceae bacterium]